MKALGEFIRTTFVGGLLVILPFGLVVMLVMKLAGMLKPFADAIAGWLPRWLHFPDLVALVLFLLVCLFVGLLARTRAGKEVGSFFERAVLNHIPGYSSVRSFTRRIGDLEETEKFAPALAEIEDSLVPAFVVEKHVDGRYTIFVPSAPTPGVGAIYIMSSERVHLLDVTFLKAARCVTSWGAGSAELLKAMRASERAQPEKPDEI